MLFRFNCNKNVVMENIDKYLYYRDFLIKLSEYIIKIAHERDGMDMDNELIVWYQNAIKRTYEWYDKGKKGMLSQCYRASLPDTSRWRDFLIANRQYFLDTYGIDLMELDKKRLEKIAKISERGKIKTDNEFRMIEEHVSELCEMDGNQEMIDKLNVLLLDYEKLAEEKLQKRRKRSVNK